MGVRMGKDGTYINVFANDDDDLVVKIGDDGYHFQDGIKLFFGDSDDVSIQWDGTNLIVTAAADDSVIEIGDAGATQKSFDLKVYGDAANGADYLSWDASASKRTGDSNGIGLTLSVKTDAGAPGTTGTPTGSVVFNTNDDNLYVYNGSAWVKVALT